MLEFLNISSRYKIEKRNDFVSTPELLEYSITSLIRTAEYNNGLFERLLELAHQKPTAEVEFKVVAPEKTDGVFNVSVVEEGRVTPIFTIGFGTTSVFYVNKFTETDRMIYKAKLHGDIKSNEDLVETIKDFIMTTPTQNEVVDISREALERKMNARKEHQPADFESFKRKAS